MTAPGALEATVSTGRGHLLLTLVLPQQGGPRVAEVSILRVKSVLEVLRTWSWRCHSETGAG